MALFRRARGARRPVTGLLPAVLGAAAAVVLIAGLVGGVMLLVLKGESRLLGGDDETDGVAGAGPPADVDAGALTPPEDYVQFPLVADPGLRDPVPVAAADTVLDDDAPDPAAALAAGDATHHTVPSPADGLPDPATCRPRSDPGLEHLEPRPRMTEPEAVRGIYLNAWAFGSSRRRAALLDLAERTELNAFVLDVKDASGFISYPTRVAMAQEIGADCELRIRDPIRALTELEERGVFPIARIVVFLDPILAERRPDLSIRHVDGSVWRDHHDQSWVDPYNREVWDYHIALAREAALLGFAEIQWDYVRFPDVPRSYMATAVYPARAERLREEAIREFLEYSREQLADLDIKVTADVFGLTVSARDDMGIGQRWDRMMDVTDVLLPMIYPSHFAPGSYGIERPNAEPYHMIREALEHAIRRTPYRDGIAQIRPWLQDFTLGEPRYGPTEVRAQIEAVYDVGLTSWILWNSASRYTEGALASATGEPPILAPASVAPPADTIVTDTIRGRY